MFTKERVLQVIEESEGTDYILSEFADLDFAVTDGAVGARNELVARLGLDVIVDECYEEGIHVWFSLRICDKDGNKETFNRIIDGEFGFTVDGRQDEEILADITDVVSGWQEQYEDIKRRFEIA